MSTHDKHTEKEFEYEIVKHLVSANWIEGTSEGYDKELSLYPDDLISYIKATQSQADEKMEKREGGMT